MVIQPLLCSLHADWMTTLLTAGPCVGCLQIAAFKHLGLWWVCSFRGNRHGTQCSAAWYEQPKETILAQPPDLTACWSLHGRFLKDRAGNELNDNAASLKALPCEAPNDIAWWQIARNYPST